MGTTHFRDLDVSEKTYERSLKAIKHKHSNYEHIPVEHRNGEINFYAAQHAENLLHIPAECWTASNVKYWWIGKSLSLDFIHAIPKDIPDIYVWLIDLSPYYIKYVPKVHITYGMACKALKYSSNLSDAIPHELWDDKLKRINKSSYDLRIKFYSGPEWD